MRNYLFKSAGLLLICFAIASEGSLFSQTAGTFSFSVTTTSSGGYTPSHLLAIWIQNNNISGSSTGFIKTKIKYANTSNTNGHLQTWSASSGKNVVDAITGSTLTSHGTVTFLWNGTNVAGTLVPDGVYYTWLEMAWDDDLVLGKTVDAFAFTKGPSYTISTPANTANFLNLSLVWTPSTTGIEGELENNDIVVYPNPSSGLLNVDFKYSLKMCTVDIINGTGRLVYNEKIFNLEPGPRIFDLTGLPAGIYYCTLHMPAKDLVFSIILTK
jgi:hypothetical protein